MGTERERRERVRLLDSTNGVPMYVVGVGETVSENLMCALRDVGAHRASGICMYGAPTVSIGVLCRR